MDSIGIYPGSFFPFHRGHYNIALKAEKLFDNLIIAQGINPLKGTSLPPKPDVPFEVYRFNNSLAKMYLYFKNTNPSSSSYIIRGLRNGYDLSYEEILRKTVEDAMPEGVHAPFVYLFCDRKYEHISSSMIRQLQSIGEDVSKYIYDGEEDIKKWQ